MKIFHYFFLFLFTACAVHKTPLPNVSENPVVFAKLTTGEIKKILDTPLCIGTDIAQECDTEKRYTFADALTLLYTEMTGKILQKDELFEKVRSDPLFQEIYLLQEPCSKDSSSASPIYAFKITGRPSTHTKGLRFTFKKDYIYIIQDNSD